MTIDLSRRDFLKAAGAVAAWTCVPKMLHGAAQGPVSSEKTAAVLVDLTRCIGCRACTRACRLQNHLREGGSDVPPLSSRMPLAWDEYTVVNTAGGRNIKQQCMHCIDPSCVSACPVAALYKHELGPILYRPERCIGCRYCMVACPFDVPKFEWDSGLTPEIGKCNFCASERLFRGGSPACAEACPTGALKFGTRSALLAEAHERLRAHPEKYIDHVYGENEAGGTSWVYLSDVPFETIGFKKNLPESPMPSFTWEVISRLPSIVGALALLFGLVATSLSKKQKEEAAA